MHDWYEKWSTGYDRNRDINLQNIRASSRSCYSVGDTGQRPAETEAAVKVGYCRSSNTNAKKKNLSVTWKAMSLTICFSLFWLTFGIMRLTNWDVSDTDRTYQDDDPDWVVCKQQEAEDNKTHANHLVHSCSLKTKNTVTSLKCWVLHFP